MFHADPTFHDEVIVLRRKTGQTLRRLLSTAVIHSEVDVRSQYIVKMKNSPALLKHDDYERFKSAVRDLGGEISWYIPHSAHIVTMTERAAHRLLNHTDAGVSWIGHYRSEWKLQPQLTPEHIYMKSKNRENDEKHINELSELAVLLHTNTMQHLTSTGQLAQHWNHLLSHHVNSHVRVTSVSNTKIIITCEHKHVPEVSKWAAEQLETHWVEHHQHYKPLNHYAQWITQSFAKGERPIWEKGIRGQGQVVGISDSGIDSSHCQFADPAVKMEYNKLMPTHRKIAKYLVAEKFGLKGIGDVGDDGQIDGGVGHGEGAQNIY